MWVHDPETLRILEVNDAAVEHYGYSREEFIRMTLADLRPTEDVGAILKENSATNSTKLTGPWRHRRKDGSYIQVDMASHCIDYQGRKCSFVLVQDVTDRQQLHEQLVHQAHHDSSPGCPIGCCWKIACSRVWPRRPATDNKPRCCAWTWIAFKQINDTFGHAAGDLCLQQVVKRISARCAPSIPLPAPGEMSS
jgi:PAS domain S-box-containing protein